MHRIILFALSVVIIPALLCGCSVSYYAADALHVIAKLPDGEIVEDFDGNFHHSGNGWIIVEANGREYLIAPDNFAVILK